MDRRDFIGTGVAGAIAATGITPAAATAAPVAQGKTFQCDYAPHFGMFRTHAPNDTDELKFMHDQGFRSLEDNGMAGRSVADQEKIAKEMQLPLGTVKSRIFLARKILMESILKSQN
jgi:hydroxypyruvate isomerase